MSDTPPDGLAILNAQRQRARRSMPAPRHPATGEDRISKDKTVAPENSPAPKPKQRRPRPAPTPAQPGATFKVTLYVDQDTDDFMEAARVTGMTSRPKVDVSRSAVVRLALRRLMDDMSPEQVKSALAAEPAKSTGPGRKRR